MGFTVEDMMIISSGKYRMKMVAGRNGWANSISWLLMVEDLTITTNFAGKELVVTTGLGFESEEKLLELVKVLDEHHGAGLIVNTGFYIKEIPKSVLEFCDKKDLPLMTVPWDVIMSEMIKDLTVRIFLQSQTDEQISAAFIKAIEQPSHSEEYKETVSQAFDADGKFQVVLLTTDDLDSMDSMERRRIGYRLQIYLENISHNGHFFYYNGNFVLILNAVDPKSTDEIIDGFIGRARKRMTDKFVYVGVGTPVNDVVNLHVSFERAVYAIKNSKQSGRQPVYFDELGVFRLLYCVSDPMILREMGEDTLRPLIEHDKAHNSDLTDTLYYYLRSNCSIQSVAKDMFVHKNTIVYRINKIKELLDTGLEDDEERLRFYLACMIQRM